MSAPLPAYRSSFLRHSPVQPPDAAGVADCRNFGPACILLTRPIGAVPNDFRSPGPFPTAGGAVLGPGPLASWANGSRLTIQVTKPRSNRRRGGGSCGSGGGRIRVGAALQRCGNRCSNWARLQLRRRFLLQRRVAGDGVGARTPLDRISVDLDRCPCIPF